MLLPTRTTALASEQNPFPVRDDLTKRLKTVFFESAHRDVVVVANDASLGALGAFTQGRRGDFLSAPDDVMYVCVTAMGVGAGIVLDGALMRGTDDFAGEIGHLRVRPGPEGPLCPNCGGRGCLQTLASEKVVVQLRAILHPRKDEGIDEILARPHPAVEEALREAGWWLGC